MALLDPLRRNKKKAEKHRLTVLIGETIKGHIHKFSEQRPEKSATAIVCDAIDFAYRHDMYKEDREALNEMRASLGVPFASVPEGARRPIAMDKKTWCERYGGVCDGVNCVYDKYEVTMMGKIVKSRMSQPLRVMPDNQDDFCKSVLGGFTTLSEAEDALEKQGEDQESPV